MKSVEISGISKHYGEVKALDNVTFTIKPGKIYGLLGRNGAGKTTLLNLITGRIFPNGGEIMIDGHNVCDNEEVLRDVYYMTEKNLYPEGEKIRNIFKWTREFCPLFDVEYAGSLCEKFGLNMNKKVTSLFWGWMHSTGICSIRNC